MKGELEALRGKVDFYEHITHHMFNQMHANGGIRKHSQVAVDVLFNLPVYFEKK